MASSQPLLRRLAAASNSSASSHLFSSPLRRAGTSPISRCAMAASGMTVSGRRYKTGPFGYTQAKALVYSENIKDPREALTLHTHTISPGLPTGTVLLKALATPVNPADINMIQGTYGSKGNFNQLLGTATPTAVGGNEGCFEVVSVSSPDTGLAKGDWVVMKHTGQGTWRTHWVVDAKSVSKIKNKEGLTPIQVGTVSVNPCTAYRMLRDFETLKEGDWFIQNGANSGVGRAAIQLGRVWGYKSINIVRSRESAAETEKLKQELVDLGATIVVTQEELEDKEFLTSLRSRLKEEAGSPKPARLALNCVGGTPASNMIKLVAPGSHIVTYGGMSKRPLMVGAGQLIFQDLKFVGFWVSRWSDANPDEKAKTVDEILDLTRQGKFKDIPVQEVKWDWETDEKILKDAVAGSLDGFRAGKAVFVYGDI